MIANSKDQAVKDVEKLKRDCNTEIRLLNQSWGSRHKMLESKCAELEADLNEVDEAIHQRQMELIHLKEQKDRVFQELSSKLQSEMSTQVGLTRKSIENKIKMHDNTKQVLNKKIEELGNELKAEEKKYTAMETKFENDNNLLRQKIANLKKDNSTRFSDFEKIQKNVADINSAIQVLLFHKEVEE